jgi:pentatricopeptide repeat protein
LFGIQLRNFDPTILANVPKKFQHIKAQDLTGVILNDPNIYSEMIKIYAQNGYPEQVYELIEHIKSQYSAQNQRKTVIKSAKEAFDLIGKAKQFEVEEQPDTVFGLAQPDLFNEEENVFNRKKSQLPQLPNFADLKVYNHMIDACAALGKIQEVIDIFELIKSRDIEPTIDTFNAVIKSFVPNALTEATLTILEEMHEVCLFYKINMRRVT